MKSKLPYKHNIHVEMIDPSPSDHNQIWRSVVGVQLLSCPSDQGFAPNQRSQSSSTLAEEVDFINALYLIKPSTTFALRYITRPNQDSFSAGKVDICIFGVTQADNENDSLKQARELAMQLIMQLGGTFPNYKWHVISDANIFHMFWKPFEWDKAYISELRRREEMVELDKVHQLRPVGFLAQANQNKKSNSEPVYYVHPFVPRPGRFERLLRIMLLHHAPISLTTIISPTSLIREEEQFLLDSIMTSEGYHTSTTKNLERIQQQRARLLAQGIMDQLLRLQDAPFLLTINLASPEVIPSSINEAAGVAISAPVGEGLNPIMIEPLLLQKGGYDVVCPSSDEERSTARKNQFLLKQDSWGIGVASEKIKRIRYLMDAYEASCAFRFPKETEDSLAGIDVHSRRIRPLPREIAQLPFQKKSNDLLPLGDNDYLGLKQPVCIPVKDRATHLYVVGQTGTGKTNLLKNMILSDMEAGRGIGVIDPHGDLFDEILQIIPENRLEDVVIFDPSDVDFPVGFNLLECSSDQQRQIVVREMRSIMRRYFDDTYRHMAVEYTGPVFYQHMQMNMLLAMSDPDKPGTLLEFYQIYQSRNYWKRWLPLKWSDEQLRHWVFHVLSEMDYTARGRSHEATFGEYLSSKFIDFIFDPRLRLIFGQRYSSINLSSIINEGKILLVNLAKGLIGESNAQFLGSMLMAKLQAEVMNRANMEPADRKPFYLYVDEFQSLATENFSVLLSEARKFGVSLILANQFISQIKDPKIMQSIFGNVGILLAFRMGIEDAKTIQSQFFPYFDYTDLTNLPNWQVCVKAKIEGQTPPPFVMNTRLNSAKPSDEIAGKVLSLSRNKYGKNREEVEVIIQDSLQEPKAEEREEEREESVWEYHNRKKRQFIKRLKRKWLLKTTIHPKFIKMAQKPTRQINMHDLLEQYKTIKYRRKPPKGIPF